MHVSFIESLKYIFGMTVLALLLSCNASSRNPDRVGVCVLYEQGFEENHSAFLKDKLLPFLVLSTVRLSGAGHSKRLESGKVHEYAGFTVNKLKTVSFLRITSEGEYDGTLLLDKSLFGMINGGDTVLIKLLQGGSVSVEIKGDPEKGDAGL
jgi:hypothetical protein